MLNFFSLPSVKIVNISFHSHKDFVEKVTNHLWTYHSPVKLRLKGSIPGKERRRWVSLPPFWVAESKLWVCDFSRLRLQPQKSKTTSILLTFFKCLANNLKTTHPSGKIFLPIFFPVIFPLRLTNYLMLSDAWFGRWST